MCVNFQLSIYAAYYLRITTGRVEKTQVDEQARFHLFVLMPVNHNIYGEF